MMNTNTVTDYMFEKIVGQDSAKAKLSFYHQNCFQKNRVMGNFLLTGAKGNGKSELAMAIGRGLYQADETGKPCLKSDGKTPLPRTFREINASTIKSTAQFINSVLIPHVVEKEVTVMIDEASEIPHNVAMAMLTMLNVNATNKTQFVDIQSDYIVDLDFSKCSFIFCTTDAQKIFAPLCDRLIRLDLEEYTIGQLGEIIQRNLKSVTFEQGVLNEIATTVRGNARGCITRSKEIAALVTAQNTFGFQQWRELKHALAILPLGVSQLELSLLRICSAHRDGVTLTGMAARTGLSRQSIQQDYEQFLMKQNLLTVSSGKGRTLTGKGSLYLKNLDKTTVVV